ncbi:hypothetical protein [Rubrivirga sp.]|uniref:hypothetical protein n=1 Tax=Rubrivirga sp. TaxID=1885344 RepID=UPI003C75F61D
MAQESRGPVHVCRLPVVETAHTTSRAEARRGGIECDPALDGARIEVDYTGFPSEAEAAFQRAVDVWACRIRSTQTIRVRALWVTLDGTTLGSAGPILFRDFDGAPAEGVWYPAALADALSGRDLGDGDPDIEAMFNSDFQAWHFGEQSPPAGRFDLETVVLHELGHGLGLIGALTVEDGIGGFQSDRSRPFSYDLHVQDGFGTSLLDTRTYPFESRALADALESEVRFAGTAVEQAVGITVPLYAPDRFVVGASLSHLSEEVFAAGTPDGLMTPFISRQETVAAPGPATCGMLADLGWRLAGECDALVGTLEDRRARLFIDSTGPNPFRSRTGFRISSSTPTTIRIDLVDALGRVLEDYGTTVLGVGSDLEVEVSARGLASGVYFLRLRGGAAPLSVPVTVTR